MNCYKLLQIAAVAILAILVASLRCVLKGGNAQIFTLTVGSKGEKGVGNIKFSFFKLTVFTVTTVTINKIKYIKANAVKDFNNVTVERKLILTVTNCYKLLQSATVRDLDNEIRHSKGL